MALDDLNENELLEVLVKIHKVTPDKLFVYVPGKKPGQTLVKGLSVS